MGGRRRGPGLVLQDGFLSDGVAIAPTGQPAGALVRAPRHPDLHLGRGVGGGRGGGG